MRVQCTECGRFVSRSPCTIKDVSVYRCNDCHRKNYRIVQKKHDYTAFRMLRRLADVRNEL
jgi:hypothetical protein